VRVQRLGTAPIIRPEMLPGAEGANINGPALIRIPAWVARPLGRYYLYFAHHQGRYIRLAYADRLEGPWTVHAPGVLRLEDAPPCVDHVASPDVIADEAGRRLRLYFHCPVGRADAPQKTFLALSGDGLRFQASPVALGDAYFRVFRRPDAWYASAWGGRLFRSPDGTSAFEPGPSPLDVAPRAPLSDTPGPRHVAIHARGDHVWVYYSSIGDEPERILRRRLDTTGEWKSWRTGAAEEVLSPETDYEGTDLPVVRSRWSAATGRERALRDPFIFEEAGRTYLLYSVAGESGIAIAEILGEGKAPTPVAPLPTPVPPPPPDVADAAYGPHERNVLDLWRARSERPTPLVIFLHGGGFRQGDKRQVPEPLVREALRAGVSVASVNYRLTDVATFPAPMLDGVRAIQFLRSKSREWNLDPARFAAGGTSAGGGIAMWAAFHDDLARPGRADPVERESSRLMCVGASGGQTSYDPRFIRAHVGGSDMSHSALLPFYGLPREQFDTPRAHELFEAASPLTYLTADDPPAFLFYAEGPPVPLPADAPENLVIHHAQLGAVLKEKMQALGIRCEVRTSAGSGIDRRDHTYMEMLALFRECFARR
jgi:acetyl esterase/lipase